MRAKICAVNILFGWGFSWDIYYHYNSILLLTQYYFDDRMFEEFPELAPNQTKIK